MSFSKASSTRCDGRFSNRTENINTSAIFQAFCLCLTILKSWKYVDYENMSSFCFADIFIMKSHLDFIVCSDRTHQALKYAEKNCILITQYHNMLIDICKLQKKIVVHVS